MSGTDEVIAKVKAVDSGIDEAKQRTGEAFEYATDVVERAAANGWEDLATGTQAVVDELEAVVDELEAVVDELGNAGDAIDENLTILATITGHLNHEKIAEHYGRALGKLNSARGRRSGTASRTPSPAWTRRRRVPRPSSGKPPPGETEQGWRHPAGQPDHWCLTARHYRRSRTSWGADPGAGVPAHYRRVRYGATPESHLVQAARLRDRSRKNTYGAVAWQDSNGNSYQVAAHSDGDAHAGQRPMDEIRRQVAGRRGGSPDEVDLPLMQNVQVFVEYSPCDTAPRKCQQALARQLPASEVTDSWPWNPRDVRSQSSTATGTIRGDHEPLRER